MLIFCYPLVLNLPTDLPSMHPYSLVILSKLFLFVARCNFELLTSVFFFFLVTVCLLSIPSLWGSCQGIKVLLTCPESETAKPKSSFSIWRFQKLGLWISQGKDQKDSGVRKLVPKPVNCKLVCVCVRVCVCVCVCVRVCTLGVHRLPKVVRKDMCGFNQWLQLSSWSVCRHFYHLEGFMLTSHTSLFPISLLIHPYSCCDGKTNSWGPNQGTLWNTDTEKAKCSNDWQKLPSTETVSTSLF